MLKRPNRILQIVLAACCLASLNAFALSPGVTFSIDFQGPGIGKGIGTGPPEGLTGAFGIDEGAILTPAPIGFLGPSGPNPPMVLTGVPGILVDSAAATAATIGNPIYGGLGRGLGIGAGAGAVELDALSYGKDVGALAPHVMPGGGIYFSVDEFAIGPLPGAGSVPPNVGTEGALGLTEAAGDAFGYLGFGPTAALGPGPGNTQIFDGAGFGPAGVGLVEPSPGFAGPDLGHNLDALDLGTSTPDLLGPIYYSLDGPFADPLEPAGAFAPGGAPNSATGPANGVSGASILLSPAPGAASLVYAAAAALGLDLVGGAASDDLDALLLIDDGDGLFTPDNPLTAAIEGTDFVLFSVRRGSAVIGMLDSMFGVPIGPGDILTIPTAGGGTVFPSLYISAEALGLGTIRSGTAGVFGPLDEGDDLDALSAFDAVIPIPATLPLMASALAGLAVLRRRRTA